MKEFSLRLVDVVAGVMWLLAGALALLSDAGHDPARVWVPVLAVLAALITVVGWLSRKLEHLENHVYTEGFRAGFDGKQVIQIPGQRERT